MADSTGVTARSADWITMPTAHGCNLPQLAVTAWIVVAVTIASATCAAAASQVQPLMIGPAPVDFILFAAVLLGVAVLHHHTFQVAMVGLGIIVAWKLASTGFTTGPGLPGLVRHLAHEWVILANLFCLLMGFALLARHFEDSGIPDIMPALLPDDWRGGFVLLAMVFVVSSFLDNIAAALIGGSIARKIFRDRVHIGFIAALVAASNAGGSGSVVGDTTTTMMWIAGVSPLSVLEAFIGAGVALVIFGIPAARLQQAYAPITRDAEPGIQVDWTRVGVVAVILSSAFLANVWANLYARQLLEAVPVIGLAVWAAILLTAPLRPPTWSLIQANLQGTLFLLALVTCASLMPVASLPPASWPAALGLGFVSAVFDNIPLTALALRQGGWDWGFLAYAVGFGGSILWFGSSAGVAIASIFPEARSVGAWLYYGWFIAVAYLAGFLVMLAVLGWRPDAPLDHRAMAPARSIAKT